MRSIDPFLGRERRAGYDCLDFAVEVWKHLLDEDLGPRFRAAFGEGGSPFGLRRAFRVLDHPRSPCLVLMQRPRAGPHIGIYLDGKILHLLEYPALQPVWAATIRATRVTYFDTRGGEEAA